MHTMSPTVPFLTQYWESTPIRTATGFFRVTTKVDPKLSAHLLGMVMIGKLPNEVDSSEVETRLRSLPTPQKNAIPEQNCVTWVISAIRTLQDAGLAEQFNLDEFMAYAIGYADQRMDNPAGAKDIVNYTSRPM
jgi:hypothetical protein